MKKLLLFLTICGLISCTVYKGEPPTKVTTWYIYQIDEDNKDMYTYFAMEIDPSNIKVNNTWFAAPAKSHKLFDTICFTTYKPVNTKMKQ